MSSANNTIDNPPSLPAAAAPAATVQPVAPDDDYADWAAYDRDWVEHEDRALTDDCARILVDAYGLIGPNAYYLLHGIVRRALDDGPGGGENLRYVSYGDLIAGTVFDHPKFPPIPLSQNAIRKAMKELEVAGIAVKRHTQIWLRRDWRPVVAS